MKFKLMAVEVGEKKSKGKQVSCIDSQLISLAVQIACFNSC